MNKFRQASTQPLVDLDIVTYEGQDPNRRMYKSGYESYMNALPVIKEDDPHVDIKTEMSIATMKKLAKELVKSDFIRDINILGKGEFQRTILAIEPVVFDEGHVKEQAEIVVANWGDEFESPVHGHSPGFIHEELLTGKMLINTYRKVSAMSNVVRPVSSYIVNGNNTIASIYAKDDPTQSHKRHVMVHNFKSIGPSQSLHYLPEHTRDGRDNTFQVEHFHHVHGLLKSDVTRITSYEGMYLRKGDVVLVRSSNVEEYGDHYIVVTGHPVVKEHGLRPQEVSISAPNATILNQYESINGLILLKLNDVKKKQFLDFHGIKVMEDLAVIFPQY